MTSETIIISRIKYFQIEYPDGVPLNILKLDLDLSVEEIQKNLLSLEEQGILFIENEEYVKLVDNIEEEKPEKTEDISQGSVTVEITSEVEVEKAKTYDLTENEIKALEIIKSLTDESGHIPRYIMEGTLLYGDLKLNTLGVYNLIMSLENRGIIKKVQIHDSEYYAI
jgi:hypothetical protein